MPDNIYTSPINIPTGGDLPFYTEGNVEMLAKGYSDAPPIIPNIELYKPDYTNRTSDFVKDLRNTVLNDLTNFGKKDTLSSIISDANRKIDLSPDRVSIDNYETLSDGTLLPKYKYYKSGINNLEEFNASFQTDSDKLWNPLKRAAVKVGRGMFADIGSFVYGIGEAALTGRAESIFDNSFSNYIDDLDKRTDFSYKNYYEKGKDNLGLNLYTWDKALGGAEFTARMIGSEALIALATGGASLPASMARRAGQLALGTARVADRIEDVSKIGNYASKVVRLMQKPVEAVSGARGMQIANNTHRVAEANQAIIRAGKLGDNLLTARFAITGSMYEAGFEARHYKNEAEADFWQYYRDNGIEPTADEITKFREKLDGTEWGVFGTNMAILSTSNMALFGKMLNIKAPAKIAETSFFDRNIAKMGTELVDGSYRALKTNMLNKTAGYLKPVGKGIFWEGFFEEGNQGIASNTFKNYVAASYDKDAMRNTKDFVDAFGKAFKDQYTTKGGIEEIAIGGLIGGLFGGVGGIRETSRGYKNAKTEATVLNAQKEFVEDTISKIYTGTNITELLGHNNRLQHIDNKLQNAQDGVDHSLTTVESFISMLDASHSVGKEGQFKELLLSSTLGLDVNTLMDKYNITAEEAQSYKQDIHDTFKQVADIYAEFNEAGKYLFRGNVGVEHEGKALNSQNLIKAYAYTNTMGSFAQKMGGDALINFQNKFAEVSSNKEIVNRFGSVIALQQAGESQKMIIKRLQNEEKRLIAERERLENEIRKLDGTQSPDIKISNNKRKELGDKLEVIQKQLSEATSKKDAAWNGIVDNFYTKLGTSNLNYLPLVDLDTFDSQMKDLQQSFDEIDMSSKDKIILQSYLDTVAKSTTLYKSFNTLANNLADPKFRYKTYKGLFANRRALNKPVNEVTKEVFMQLLNTNTNVDEVVNNYINQSLVTNEVISEMRKDDGVVKNEIYDYVLSRKLNGRTLTPNEQIVYDQYKEQIDNDIKTLNEDPLNAKVNTDITEEELRINTLEQEIQDINDGKNEEVNKQLVELDKQYMRDTAKLNDEFNNTENRSDEVTTEEGIQPFEAAFIKLELDYNRQKQDIKQKAIDDKISEKSTLEYKLDLEKRIKILENELALDIAEKLSQESEIKSSDIARGEYSTTEKDTEPIIKSESKIQSFKNKDLVILNRILSQFKSIVNYGQVYTVDEIDKIFNNKNFNRNSTDVQLWKGLLDFAKESNLKFIFDLKPLEFVQANKNRQAAAYYSLDTHTVTFNIGNIVAYGGTHNHSMALEEKVFETIVHETLHAATTYAISNDVTTDEISKIIVEDLTQLFEKEKRKHKYNRYKYRNQIRQLREEINNSENPSPEQIEKLQELEQMYEPYGFTDVNEFVANMAGTQFRKVLVANASLFGKVLNLFGINKTADTIIAYYEGLRDGYDYDRIIGQEELSNDPKEAIQKRYETLQIAEDLGGDIESKYDRLMDLKNEYEDNFGVSDTSTESNLLTEEALAEMTPSEQLTAIAKQHPDYLLVDENGEYSPNVITKEESERLEQMQEEGDTKNPEYDKLREKQTNTTVINSEIFSGATLSEIIDMAKQLKERNIVQETQLEEATPETIQEFNDKTLNDSFKNQATNPMLAQVYDGAYVKVDGDTMRLNHISLYTIFQKALDNGYAIEMEIFETKRRKKSVIDTIEITEDNFSEVAKEYESKNDYKINLIKNDEIIPITRPLNRSHLMITGENLIKNVLGFEVYDIVGRANPYKLLYHQNISGSYTPYPAEYTVTRNGKVINFDTKAIEELKNDDDVEFVYDPNDDYNKTLDKKDRKTHANIYIMKDGKLLGVLKSSKYLKGTQSGDMLHLLRVHVINRFDQKKPNVITGIVTKYAGAPYIEINESRNPIAFDIENEDNVVTYGYITPSGETVLMNENVNIHVDSYTNKLQSDKAIPIVVFKHNGMNYSFPINVKPLEVGDTAVEEFDKIMNNPDFTMVQKRLRVNGLLQKYGFDDSGLYWKTNKTNTDRIREALSTATQDVNFKNFDSFEKAKKSTYINLSNPFMTGRLLLMHPPELPLNREPGETISIQAYDKFLTTGKIHQSTMDKILKLVENGQTLTPWQEEFFQSYNKNLTSSVKTKPRSRKGKNKSDENTC